MMFTVFLTMEKTFPFKGSKILWWFLSVCLHILLPLPTQDVPPSFQFHDILLLFPLWLK